MLLKQCFGAPIVDSVCRIFLRLHIDREFRNSRGKNGDASFKRDDSVRVQSWTIEMRAKKYDTEHTNGVIYL